jgi:hypothetical protein
MMESPIAIVKIPIVLYIKIRRLMMSPGTKEWIPIEFFPLP